MEPPCYGRLSFFISFGRDVCGVSLLLSSRFSAWALLLEVKRRDGSKLTFERGFLLLFVGEWLTCERFYMFCWLVAALYVNGIVRCCLCPLSRFSSFFVFCLGLSLGCVFGGIAPRKGFGLLVSLGCQRYRCCTCDLSTSSSLTALLWRSYLEGGFVLRCFQHLSWPEAATRRCSWRYNRFTGAPSNTVLSY